MSANRALLDESLRHAIALRRYGTGEVKSLLALLSDSEQELARQLAGLDPTKFGTKRARDLLEKVKTARAEAVRELRSRSQKQMLALAKQEQAHNIGMLQRSIPVVGLEYATVPIETLRSIVTEDPFSGGANAARTLAQWWQGVEAADQSRILGAVQLGASLGEDISTITKRVMRAADMTRANAEAVTRTAINHVSNKTRQRVMEANSDVVKAERWTSVLDGRTTLICAGRDGHYAPVGDTPIEEVPQPHLDPITARPPAHPNCRSVMTPEVDISGLAQRVGERPTVVDTRTRKERELDFRAAAKDEVGADQWKEMDAQERAAAVRAQREAWAKRAVGTTRSSETYDEWLRRQDKDFQDDVLGPARGKLFRSGMLVEQFTDDTGKTLTLEQLGAERPAMGGLPAPPETAKPPLDFGEANPLNVDQKMATLKAHEEMHDSWRKQVILEDEHWNELKDYQNTGYKYVNKDLRTGEIHDYTEEATKWLDDAIDKSPPLEQDLYVYRRGNLSLSSVEKLFGGVDPREGAVVEDKGYTSTSLSKNLWETFDTGMEPTNSIYNFRIRIPEGMKIIPMEPFSGEAEILLKRNAKFRVVKSRRIRLGYEVEMEMLHE